MKKLMNMLLLSCLKATELIEKRLHLELTWTENMQLKAHKMMCDACVRYERQSTFLDKGIAKIHKNKFTEAGLKQLKQQITKRIESAR